MMTRLNVLFLASWYPNELNPQNGNFIQRHAEAVSKFCNVFVIHVRARNQQKKYVCEKRPNKNVKEFICWYSKHSSSTPNDS